MKNPFKRKNAVSPKKVGTVTFTLNTEKDLEKYLKYLAHPWQIMWRNFLAGTFHGVGFILGTAIFLGILGYIVNSVMGELPFFSDFAKALNVWLQTTLEN